MGSYIPSTPAERQAMLEAIGLKDYRDLYRDVPQSMILDLSLIHIFHLSVHVFLSERGCARNYRPICPSRPSMASSSSGPSKQ